MVLFSLAVMPPVYTAVALHAAAQEPLVAPDPDEDPDPEDPDPEEPEPLEPEPVLLPDTSVQSEAVVGFQPVAL